MLYASPNPVNKKATLLEFEPVLRNAAVMYPGVNIVGGSVKQDFQMTTRLDHKILEDAKDVLEQKKDKIALEYPITNYDRTFGATLSYEISMYEMPIALHFE